MTIEECRRLLGDTTMTDAEIQELLRGIHKINVQVLDEYFREALADDAVH